MLPNGQYSGKLVILSAPSGAGKTTIMKEIRKRHPSLEFSVSATSRLPRHNEQHGVDYYFLTGDEFRRQIGEGLFVEWEEVYPGTHYGTLRSEMERIWQKGNSIIFDIDVKGGIRLKEMFGAKALSIFIMPPSVEALRHRLESRGTDPKEKIDARVAKAETEIADAPRFDLVVVNDVLADAVDRVDAAINGFLNS